MSICKTAFLTATIFVWVAANSASGQDVTDRFAKKQFKGKDGATLLYRVLSPPKISSDEKYPLVLFFHGAGERGNDNQKQLIHGMKDFASDKVRNKYPAFVIAPQCPAGQQWVDVPWNGKSHKMKEVPSRSMKLSLALVEQFMKVNPVDRSRVYVTGLSMGGFGTFDAIGRRPDLFAAALPICGGGDETVAEKIKSIPIWVVHGDADRAVLPERSANMVNAIRRAGGKAKLTMIKGVGHNSWSATYSNPETYEWLFKQKMKLSD